MTRPALTPEEWATKIRLGSDPAIIPMKRVRLMEYSDGEGNWNSLHIHGVAAPVSVNRPDMHAVAALALHGQPFGFTRADVDALSWAFQALTELKSDIMGTLVLSIAGRIEALLPPEP